METLNYILKKFNLSCDDKTDMPIVISGVGRDQLAELLKELNFKTGVEVGVAAGEYSEILCQANPQMKLYGVDPYKPYKGYRDYARPSTFARLYEEAKQRLAARPNYEFVEQFSLDAVKRFDDNSLDFVYIDGNHQEPYVSQDITEWHKKVRPGGILAGHDYTRVLDKDAKTVIHDVRRAVRTFTGNTFVGPWFVFGRNKTVEGELRDSPRSWVIVKP